MEPRIAVVDYHKGNLQSVVRSLADAGANAWITDDPSRIRTADAVVVPGVGAFEDAMSYMRESGEADAICGAVSRNVPLLGICLGLQVLFDRGEERSGGQAGEPMEGLGILRGSVTRLRSERLKVPHVGWNQLHLTPLGRESALYEGVAEGSNVYFTHSFALDDDVDDDVVAARTHYTRSFASGVCAGNVCGVQFHPEKSSGTGLVILRNFVRMI